MIIEITQLAVNGIECAILIRLTPVLKTIFINVSYHILVASLPLNGAIRGRLARIYFNIVDLCGILPYKRMYPYKCGIKINFDILTTQKDQ